VTAYEFYHRQRFSISVNKTQDLCLFFSEAASDIDQRDAKQILTPPATILLRVLLSKANAPDLVKR
jgi:hypothetical protein